MTSEALAAVVERIRSAGRIVITSHIQPDGDAVGSVLALLRALKSLGKKAWAISPSHVPHGLRFLLKGENEIIAYDPAQDNPILEAADLFIIADCADPERSGGIGMRMLSLPQKVVVIDHHSTNGLYGQFNYVLPGVSSTAAMVMDVLEELGVNLTLDLALPLYVGIASDSGSFSYPGTTPLTHRKAGRLLEAGVNPYEVHRRLYLDRSSEFMRLVGMALLNVQIAFEGAIAYSVIHHDLYRKFMPRLDELPLLPPYLVAIRDIEVGVLFLEYKPRKILVELRSQGLVNVAEVARMFGGGGHAGAGGTRIGGEMSDVVFRVLTEVNRRLVRNRKTGASEEKRSDVWRRA